MFRFSFQILIIVSCFASGLLGADEINDASWCYGPPLVFGDNSAIAVGNKVVFFNGYAGGLDIYDSINDTWSVGPPLSGERDRGFQVIATTIGNKAIFAGGLLNVYQSSDAVDIYDASSDTWSRGKSLFRLITHILVNFMFINLWEYNFESNRCVSSGSACVWCCGDHRREGNLRSTSLCAVSCVGTAYLSSRKQFMDCWSGYRARSFFWCCW